MALRQARDVKQALLGRQPEEVKLVDYKEALLGRQSEEGNLFLQFFLLLS